MQSEVSGDVTALTVSGVAPSHNEKPRPTGMHSWNEGLANYMIAYRRNMGIRHEQLRQKLVRKIVSYANDILAQNK